MRLLELQENMSSRELIVRTIREELDVEEFRLMSRLAEKHDKKKFVIINKDGFLDLFYVGKTSTQYQVVDASPRLFLDWSDIGLLSIAEKTYVDWTLNIFKKVYENVKCVPTLTGELARIELTRMRFTSENIN